MSNPTELPDLDKLEALAKAAQISILRMGMNGRPNDYLALMNAMSPGAVLSLIKLARRAQPEGEAPQASIKTWKERLFSRIPEARSWPTGVVHEYGAADKDAEITELRTALATTLSPLCGTQHAASGKAEQLYADWAYSQPDRASIPPWNLASDSAKQEWQQRAAQLDGGQEGSESNG